MVATPRRIQITGADLTGAEGKNRTYTIPDATADTSVLRINIAGTSIYEGVGKGYTVSGLDITFLNWVYDDSNIEISYHYEV